MSEEIETKEFGEPKSEVIESLRDLRGDLHLHSSGSNVPGEPRKSYPIERLGKYVVERIGAKKENQPGIEYFLLAEHVGRPDETTPFQGIDTEGGQRLIKQKEEVEKIDKEGKFPGLTILQGAEVNVYPGAKLDLPDEVLKKMDMVIASRHYDLEEKTVDQQIAVWEKVVKNPYIDILGHPEGKWGEHGFQLDQKGWSKLIDLAKQYDKAIEINVNQFKNYHPDSLKMLAESGAKVSYGSDTHDLKKIGKDEKLGTDWRQFAEVVTEMRKSGIKKSQIINCLPLNELRQWRQERIEKFEKQ